MKVRARHGVFILLGFAISMSIAAVNYLPLPSVQITWPLDVVQLPPDSVSTGSEVALIYIGSSTCRWCQAEELPSLIDAARSAVAGQALVSGFGFVAVGVAVDHDVESGLKHLGDVGPFHEVTTGRRWRNIAALKYVRGDHVGPTATPQVLVIQRTVSRVDAPFISRGVVILRKVGLRDIEAWSRGGATVPLQGSAASN